MSQHVLLLIERYEAAIRAGRTDEAAAIKREFNQIVEGK